MVPINLSSSGSQALHWHLQEGLPAPRQAQLVVCGEPGGRGLAGKGELSRKVHSSPQVAEDPRNGQEEQGN
jgi:hypothetical protein